MDLRVVATREDNHLTRTLFLEDAHEGGRVFDYLAGQYLTFRFDTISPKPIARSYSLSSAPREPNQIALTVKQIPNGIASKYLCSQVQEGDILRARGPMGNFCYHQSKDHPHLVMIAAGSGVTPFLSIMKENILGTAVTPMSLIVGYPSEEESICLHDLRQWSLLPSIKIGVSFSKKNSPSKHHETVFQGRIDGATIHQFLGGEYQNKTYMICGPTSFMDLITHHLTDQGVLTEAIKVESFLS
jgi:ferredoxin-NADP reductase